MRNQVRALAIHGTYEVVHNPANECYPYEVYGQDGSLWEQFTTQTEAEYEAKTQSRADRVESLKGQIIDRLHNFDNLDTLERIASWLPQ